MNRDWANWFCGFVAGEGCFSIYPSSSGGNILTDFSIRLRADDYFILEECRDVFGGIGSLAVHESPEPLSPVAQWKVGNPKEQKSLVSFFDKYDLRAKKKNDYLIWREAVLERCKSARYRDTSALYALCLASSAAKKFNGGEVLPIPRPKNRQMLLTGLDGVRKAGQ